MFEWITFAVALAGLLLSAAIWIKDIISQRRDLRGRLLEVMICADYMTAFILLENRSRLAIAVTQIELQSGDLWIPCAQTPECILTFRNNTEVYRRVYSNELPIQIVGLGGSYAKLVFHHLPMIPEAASTHLTLRISTNRGKPFEISLQLPPDWADQRIIH